MDGIIKNELDQLEAPPLKHQVVSQPQSSSTLGYFKVVAVSAPGLFIMSECDRTFDLFCFVCCPDFFSAAAKTPCEHAPKSLVL